MTRISSQTARLYKKIYPAEQLEDGRLTDQYADFRDKWAVFDVDEHDHQLAQSVNREALANPDSAYAGKYVGIYHGAVVAVAENLDGVVQLMEKVAPDRKGMVIEASADYETPLEIW